MSEVLKIPRSEDELYAQLDSLAAMAVVVQWRRAALVTAALIVTGMTPARFAKLGIRGFKSSSAVKQYLAAWKAAVDAGIAEPIIPGEVVRLPDDAAWDELAPEPDATRASRVGGEEAVEKYRKEAEAQGTTVGLAIRVGQTPTAMVAAILADPRMADYAQGALDEWHRRQRPIVDPVPVDDFTKLVGGLRSAKQVLERSLGMAMNLNGAEWRGKRKVVVALADEVIDAAGAVKSVAQGESLDEGLERLLSEDSR